MESLTLTIRNDKIRQEILDLFNKFPTGEWELTSIEDAVDLQLPKETRWEETMAFSDCLEDADSMRQVGGKRIQTN